LLFGRAGLQTRVATTEIVCLICGSGKIRQGGIGMVWKVADIGQACGPEGTEENQRSTTNSDRFRFAGLMKLVLEKFQGIQPRCSSQAQGFWSFGRRL